MSQPQKRPHAWSAQMAPAARVKVQNTKPTEFRRNAKFSSVTESGTARRKPMRDSCPEASRRSRRDCRSCSTAMANVMVKTPDAATAMDTWMISQ